MTFDKKELRAAAIASRDAVSDEEIVAMMMRLGEIGPDIGRAYGAEVVSSFASVGREVQTASMMARLNGNGFVVCLPVTGKRGTPLTFRRWTPQTHMTAGRMGILEPPDTADIVEPDVLFVPLLAFDRRGHRIGYGAGFYDRTLSTLRATKSVVAVGVAYSVQEVLFVPNDEFDQPLDMIVTEKETILVADGG